MVPRGLGSPFGGQEHTERMEVEDDAHQHRRRKREEEEERVQRVWVAGGWKRANPPQPPTGVLPSDTATAASAALDATVL